MRKHLHSDLDPEGFPLFLAWMRLQLVEFFQFFRLLLARSRSGLALHRALRFKQVLGLGFAGVEEGVLLLLLQWVHGRHRLRG